MWIHFLDIFVLFHWSDMPEYVCRGRGQVLPVPRPDSPMNIIWNWWLGFHSVLMNELSHTTWCKVVDCNVFHYFIWFEVSLSCHITCKFMYEQCWRKTKRNARVNDQAFILILPSFQIHFKKQRTVRQNNNTKINQSLYLDSLHNMHEWFPETWVLIVFFICCNLVRFSHKRRTWKYCPGA